MSYIDALRGLACLAVLNQHSIANRVANEDWFYYPFQVIEFLSDLGWLGVSLFLVLSGFCLTYPLALKSPIEGFQLDNKEFFRRRLRRILPPYYAAIVFCLLVFYLKYFVKHHSFAGIESVVTLKQSLLDLGTHLFMVHNLSPLTFATINIAFWSLALEFQLYLIYPWLIKTAKKYGLVSIVLLTLVISLLWQCAVFYKIGSSIEWSVKYATFYHALPSRVFEFVLGMCAAYLVARPVAFQTRYALYLIGALTIPALYYTIYISRFGPALDLMWGIIFASGLIVLSHVPEEWFTKNQMLRCLTWFGGISYSVYLIHIPIFSITPLRTNAGFTVILINICRILLVTLVAYGFYLLFEKPFTRKKVAPLPPPLAELTTAVPAKVH